MFRKTFPFEGNWNSLFWVSAIAALPITSSERPSRLKGIETLVAPVTFWRISMFRKTFPFEGNWNFSSSNGSSTKTLFRKTFPFEGNWNLCCLILIDHINLVQKDLPVWRELKLFRSSGTNYLNHPVQKDLPVWRELKRSSPQPRACSHWSVQKDLPVWRELKR